MGWGGAIDKLLGWLPGRAESMRNKEARLKREIDAIGKKKNKTAGDLLAVQRLADELREVRQRISAR